MIKYVLHGGVTNNGQKVLVGFPTQPDQKGVGKLTVDTQPCLWEAAGGGASASTGAVLGKMTFLLSGLIQSGKKGHIT